MREYHRIKRIEYRERDMLNKLKLRRKEVKK